MSQIDNAQKPTQEVTNNTNFYSNDEQYSADEYDTDKSNQKNSSIEIF